MLQCLFLSLLIDEWLFLPCNLNARQTPKEARVSRLVIMWYDPFLFVPSFVCFLSSLVLCTYAFCDVLSLFFFFLYLFIYFFFFLQVEVPPPMTRGTLMEEVVGAPSAVSLVMEGEPPTGGVTEEVGQPMQDVQPILPSIPLAA